MNGLDLLNLLKTKSEEELKTLQVRIPTPVMGYQVKDSMVVATDVGFGLMNLDIITLGKWIYS